MKAAAATGPLDKAKAFWNASTTNKLIVAGGAALVLGVLWMALRGGSAPAAATPNRRRRFRANARRGYVHISWKPLRHSKWHSTIVHAKSVGAMKRRLKSAGATQIQALPTKQRPDTHYTYNRRSATRCSPLKRRVRTCRCSPAAKYRRMGATRRSDYAFPECWSYPIRFRSRSGKVNVAQTRKHIRAAASRFGKWQRRYPKTTRARIRARILSAERQYGIGR